MTRCQCASCLVKALCEYGLEPSSLPAIPGNSHGLPPGQRAHVVLLRGDGRRGPGAERDQLLGADLDGLETQAGPAAAVGEHGVERQVARVPAAQPGLDQDDHQVAGGGVRDLRDGFTGFQLCHHELGDEPGDLVVVEGELFDVDGRVGGQPGEPAVAMAGVEEYPDHRQGQRPGGRRVSLDEQPGDVVLQNRPGDSARISGLRVTRGEEPGEPGERQRPGVDGGECAPGREAEPGPPFDRVAEPGLADPVKARRAAPAPGRDAQEAGIPVV